MNKPKKHHYVPSSYQDLFRNPETNELYRLDLLTGKSSRSNPDNVMYKKHLYLLDQPPSGLDDIFIEKPLLSRLDENFKVAITKISTTPESVDKEMLAMCIAFLKNRTPNSIDEIARKGSEHITKKTYDKIISDQSLVDSATALGLNLNSFEAYKESLKGITFTASRDFSLGSMVLIAGEQAEHLYSYKWTIYRSLSNSFITSDQPVSSVEEIDEQNNPISRFWLIPLSFKYCVKVEFTHGGLEIVEVDDEGVRDINIAVAYCSKQLIVGPDEEQLHSIREQLEVL